MGRAAQKVCDLGQENIPRVWAKGHHQLYLEQVAGNAASTAVGVGTLVTSLLFPLRKAQYFYVCMSVLPSCMSVHYTRD